MEWFIQNWIPLAVGIAFVILMRRGGMCCGWHRHKPSQTLQTPQTPPKDADAQHRQ